MGKCVFCGNSDNTISAILSVCRDCILNKDWSKVKKRINLVHSKIRKEESLPPEAPKTSEENVIYHCTLCTNECKLSNNDISYCGLRNNKKKRLDFPTKTHAYMHGYIDSNPTNCCNAWFCPAGSSKGFPIYSSIKGKEYGTYSYAAFMYGCTFDCLFCQNASHKNISKRNLVHRDEIADQIINNKKITCICFFGGTPEAQMPFTIQLSKTILRIIKKEESKRIMRICWEINGTGNQRILEKCMKIAVQTGGNIKFDLKTYHEKLNFALCGNSNKKTLDNFEYLGKKYFGKRKDLPEMSGCTLLVPGYTLKEDVEEIAKFIASINPEIPYSLLIFHPDYCMSDLSITPRKHVKDCLKVAQKYLNNVNLGNKFLLGL